MGLVKFCDCTVFFKNIVLVHFSNDEPVEQPGSSYPKDFMKENPLLWKINRNTTLFSIGTSKFLPGFSAVNKDVAKCNQTAFDAKM